MQQYTDAIPATQDAEAGGLRKTKKFVLHPGQSEATKVTGDCPYFLFLPHPPQPEMTTGQAEELKQEVTWYLGFL